MARRFDLGRALLALGGAVLVIALFLKWFDTGQTGWEVFETLDLVLAGLGIAAIAVSIRVDDTPEWAGGAIAVVALVVVAVQITEPPPVVADSDPSLGAWLGLAASFLMAAGSALSLASFSVTVQVRERDARRRVPAVDRRADQTSANEEVPEAQAPATAVAQDGQDALDTTPSEALDDDPQRTQPFLALPEDESDRP